MKLFKNVTKRSITQGLGILAFLVGAAGMDISKWGLLGFKITGIPLWCFAIATSTGGILFFLGQMIFTSTPLEYEKCQIQEENRDIFLYLRPFIFDVKSIFQLAIGASAGLMVYATLIEGIWWPLALLPILGNISKEQSFKHVFEQIGQFIAFGDPKDKLKPIAATRVYVDKEWERAIFDYILAARLIIIQPGEQPGIIWEINNVMENVPPEKILFYINFKGRKKKKRNLYEQFREQMKNHSVTLPREMGKDKYLTFDSNWNPYFTKELTFNEVLSQYYMNSSNTSYSKYQLILDVFKLKLPTTREDKMLNLFYLFQPFIVVGVVILALYSIYKIII